MLEARGDRVIGVDLKGTAIDANLSAPSERLPPVDEVRSRAENGIDAVIAVVGVALPSR
jgi:hypothetical protein